MGGYLKVFVTVTTLNNMDTIAKRPAIKIGVKIIDSGKQQKDEAVLERFGCHGT